MYKLETVWWFYVIKQFLKPKVYYECAFDATVLVFCTNENYLKIANAI